jgi:hypothetical protein
LASCSSILPAFISSSLSHPRPIVPEATISCHSGECHNLIAKKRNLTDWIATAAFVASLVLPFSLCSRVKEAYAGWACSERSKTLVRLNLEQPTLAFLQLRLESFRLQRTRGEPLKTGQESDRPTPRRSRSTNSKRCLSEKHKNCRGALLRFSPEASIKSVSSHAFCFRRFEKHPPNQQAVERSNMQHASFVFPKKSGNTLAANDRPCPRASCRPLATHSATGGACDRTLDSSTTPSGLLLKDSRSSSA